MSPRDERWAYSDGFDTARGFVTYAKGLARRAGSWFRILDSVKSIGSVEFSPPATTQEGHRQRRFQCRHPTTPAGRCKVVG